MYKDSAARLVDMTSKTIAFIGGGNMAASLISGLVSDDYDPKRIIVSEPDANKLAALAARFSIQAAANNPEAVSRADVVVLAVKPQVLEQVAKDLAAAVQQRRPLVISIAAGIRESDLQSWLGGGAALVRTMPNTPAMIQTGATVLHAAENVSADQRDLAESILRSVGLTRWVDAEEKMDAVTALSGSGPAYFFLLMEQLLAAAESEGLPRETARLLVMETALGAARMVLESDDTIADLRSRVTSPAFRSRAAIRARFFLQLLAKRNLHCRAQSSTAMTR